MSLYLIFYIILSEIRNQRNMYFVPLRGFSEGQGFVIFLR